MEWATHGSDIIYVTFWYFYIYIYIYILTVITGTLCDAQFELWAQTIEDKYMWEPLIKDWRAEN
jgi:hypothetical protein